MKGLKYVMLVCMLCNTVLGCFSSCGTQAPPSPEITDPTKSTTEPTPSTESSVTTAAQTTEPPTTEAPLPERETVSLDGKKVIIIGNSYVYNGKAVITKSSSLYTQKQRENDKGYFYQLCKANGAEVSVTNWTFGGHGLSNLFLGNCGYSSCPRKDHSHEKELTDRYYDYVIVSPGGGEDSAKNIYTDFDYIIRLFKAANPNVKIVCLANLGVHGYSSFGTDFPEVYNNYKKLEDKGVIIADWGGVVAKILRGEYTVEGSTLDYGQNTFIVKDGYHPNMLAGYIASLTAYCAITGESAVGQPYEFYNDTKLDATFNTNSYIASNYLNKDTNFTDVFASEADMKAIQRLIDKHLWEKLYLNEWNKNSEPTETKLLTEEPKSGIISVAFAQQKPTGNGWRACITSWKKPETTGYAYFSGIRGDLDEICSLEGTTKQNGLTDAQKQDIADIRYGVSVIGMSHMKLTKYTIDGANSNKVESSSLMNLVNGHYGSSYPAEFYFDSKTYNINGEEDAASPYTALITLNFGTVKTFEAIGYSSSNMRVFPQAQDVYVSDDGVNWTKVNSACYVKDEHVLYPITKKSTVKDPWNNNTPLYETLFDMSNTSGKYIRIGVIKGANTSFHGISVRELMVFGK